MIVPDDEQCIQQMLGIDIIPDDIETEYMIRARMLHRQLAGGPIGPVAIVDLLRSLGYGPPPPPVVNAEGRIDWRRVERGTPVTIRLQGKWQDQLPTTFQGEIGGGTLAIMENDRYINEYNAYDVRLSTQGLPSDVNVSSFRGEPTNVNTADARLSLVEEPPHDIVSHDNLGEPESEIEVESSDSDGDIGSDDEVPDIPVPQTEVKWGLIKKGTEVWYRDGEDLHVAKFHRCVKNCQAMIHIEGEGKPRPVSRDQLQLP